MEKALHGGVGEATCRAAEHVGEEVVPVAAASEVAGLEEFYRAAEEEGKANGDAPDVGTAEMAVAFQGVHHEERGDKVHAKMHHLVDVRDVEARVGQVVRRHDAEDEDDYRPQKVDSQDKCAFGGHGLFF